MMMNNTIFQTNNMIKKTKVAIFSDLHLGIYGNSEKWHETALTWADWIVDELNQKKIKDIFFLGDFFDNRSEISVQTIHVASKIIEKFKKFNVFMIIGNHDAYYKNRSDVHSLGMMKGHENITLIDKNLEFEAFNKRFLFVPWNNDIPNSKYDYIFGHFEIQTFKMNNYTVCNHGLNPVDILIEKTNAVFSGHFHNRNSKKYNEGSIYYVGSCFPLDFSDQNNTKGYHILDIEDGSIEFFENTVSPRFIKLALSGYESYEESEIENNIIKLIVDSELSEEEFTKISNIFKSYNPWQISFEYNVNSKTLNDVENIDSIDIKEMFEEFYDQLGLDDDQLARIKKINEDLYEKNKI
jgi:DNA repair exonuclease SbcCD nuclease subunit